MELQTEKSQKGSELAKSIARCFERVGGRGFGGGRVAVGRGDSLLPIVLLLPGALIAMNATNDWTVFDGMIVDLNYLLYLFTGWSELGGFAARSAPRARL